MEQIEKLIELSKELSKIGLEVTQINFNYKIERNKDSKFWKSKLENFQKYSEKCISYYNICFSILKLFKIKGNIIRNHPKIELATPSPGVGGSS